MPTGYTAKLIEKGQTFEEFVLTCAKAFGACVEMRDDSLEVPIPEEFKPSPYYIEQIERFTKELKRLTIMTPRQKLQFGDDAKRKAIESLTQAFESNKLENERLDNMRDLVEEWEPPSSEHVELKKFMLDQIKISRHDTDSYYKNAIKDAKSRTSLSYYEERVESTNKNLTWYVNEKQKDVNRAQERTQWVKQLRDSLNEQNLDERV